MQVRRYEAVDMNEAIQMVKKDLGPDAVILSSRKIKKDSGAFGVFGRPIIEVTAAAETPVIVDRNEPSRQLYTPRRSMAPQMAPARPLNAAPAVETVRSPQLTLEPVMNGIEDLRRKLEEAATVKQTQTAPAAIGPDTESLAGEMRELKSMVAFLLDNSIDKKETDEHKNYLAVMRYLKEQGVAAEYARAIIDEIKETNGEAGVPDVKTLLYVAAARMRDSMMFDGWIGGPRENDGPKVVALTGPTGVGKTTTVAKLAAKLTMSGQKAGLVTIDTFRIAAVEQLKIYAKILDIPLSVVLSPADLKKAVADMKDLDVILIDTAGRSQRDVEQIEALNEYLEAVPGIETRLTLSAGASDGQIDEAIKNFSKSRVDGLIFTKLDEAVSLGSIYSHHVRSGIPISYFTTGQRVPEDIEEATAKRLIGGIFKKVTKSKNQDN